MQNLNVQLEIIRELRTRLTSSQNLLEQQSVEITNLRNQIVRFRPRRNYFDIRDMRDQNTIKNNIKRQIILNNQNIRGYGILQKKAEFCILNEDEHENHNITVNFTNDYLPNPFGDQIIGVGEALFIKDKYFISDKSYAIIRTNFNSKLPCLNEIKAYRKQLNAGFEYFTVNDENVKFVDIKQQIKKRFFEFLSALTQDELRDIKELRIKFTADGTNVGKNLSLVNFCFTFLEDNKHKSVFGNYTIGVGEIKEQYGALTDPFKFIMDSIRELKRYYFNGRFYEVDYFFGADMKFLLEVNGLKAANSNYPCLWCLVFVNDLHKLGYSIVDPLIARDKSKSQEHVNKRIDFGFKAISLLDIPLIKCIIDTLHLRIRIGLKLIELLLNELIILDDYDGIEFINETHLNLTKWYYEFLRKKCKIGAKLIKYNNTNKAKITRDFNGYEIVKIFRILLNFRKYFNSVENLQRKLELWWIFYWLDRGISWNTLSPDEIKIRTDRFNVLYFENYSNDEATPYIHAFCNHLHEFSRLYGNLSDFTEQGLIFLYSLSINVEIYKISIGLEKLNEFTTREYFRATNKHNDFIT
jgi:hypothetical protein